jgi:hypothetical protein
MRRREMNDQVTCFEQLQGDDGPGGDDAAYMKQQPGFVSTHALAGERCRGAARVHEGCRPRHMRG